MIEVTWVYHGIEPVYGDDTYHCERADVPRVPRVGDFVEEREVIKVIWSEHMNRAAVHLKES